jgi:ABC-type protease/lipase transport system fused ATPase/permease subunit
LSLARAVYATPAIVVFDQIDKHCDSNELAVFERLLDQLSNAGTTVIVSSHRKSIMQAADRVLLMDKKDVVFTGKPTELPEILSRKVSPQAHAVSSTAANQPAHNVDSVVTLSQRTTP